MSTAWTMVRSASVSSRKLVSLAMAIGVASGVRSSGTPARSASAGTSGGSSRPSVTSTQGIVPGHDAGQAVAPRGGLLAVEVADLAGPEHEHAAFLKVAVEAGEREAGLEHVGAA